MWLHITPSVIAPFFVFGFFPFTCLFCLRVRPFTLLKIYWAHLPLFFQLKHIYFAVQLKLPSIYWLATMQCSTCRYEKSPLVFRQLLFFSGFRDNQRSQSLKIMTCKLSSYLPELFPAIVTVMCPDSLPSQHYNCSWLSVTLGHVMIMLRSQCFSKESSHLAASIVYFWKYSVAQCISACLLWIATKHCIVSML